MKRAPSVKRVLLERKDLIAMTVNYADAISDPQSTAQRVNEFLGGQLDEQAMAAVIDRSLYRERLN